MESDKALLRSQIIDAVNAVLDKYDVELLANERQAMETTLCSPSGQQTPLRNGSPAALANQSPSESGPIRKKVFQSRNSVLTDMFRINHFQTIMNIFVTVFIILTLNVLAHDMSKGQLPDFKFFSWCFGKFSTVCFVWAMMQSSTFCAYPLFLLWAENRFRLGPARRVGHNKKESRPFVVLPLDIAGAVLYVCFQSLLLTLPLYCVLVEELPPASSLIVVLEQLRLLMKVHGFVREAAERVLLTRSSGSDDNDKLKQACPGFSSYLYFLFAPTLVYRDNYPRTNIVVWKYVFSNMCQVAGCAAFAYYIFVRFVGPVFRDFADEGFTLKAFVWVVFKSMLPGTLILLVAFFGFLHSWLNAFAEMLRFADRQFYTDWWNVTSFGSFYRTWNVVVHDWLYEYIFKDVYRLTGGSRHVALTAVFMLSAVFHEYVLVVCFRLFFPVMFLLFGGCGFGLMFVRGRSRGWNIIMWAGLFIGTGLMMALYSMEWFARQRCSPYHYGLDIFVPRSIVCHLT